MMCYLFTVPKPVKVVAAHVGNLFFLHETHLQTRQLRNGRVINYAQFYKHNILILRNFEL